MERSTCRLSPAPNHTVNPKLAAAALPCIPQRRSGGQQKVRLQSPSSEGARSTHRVAERDRWPADVETGAFDEASRRPPPVLPRIGRNKSAWSRLARFPRLPIRRQVPMSLTSRNTRSNAQEVPETTAFPSAIHRCMDRGRHNFHHSAPIYAAELVLQSERLSVKVLRSRKLSPRSTASFRC